MDHVTASGNSRSSFWSPQTLGVADYEKPVGRSLQLPSGEQTWELIPCDA